ncbi:hypothetical protein TN53_11860 [Streptomyces sp. WM6386]|nr:hypothetical protein TN53_11860 [Streptomyces sp. WM6386]
MAIGVARLGRAVSASWGLYVVGMCRAQGFGRVRVDAGAPPLWGSGGAVGCLMVGQVLGWSGRIVVRKLVQAEALMLSWGPWVCLLSRILMWLGVGWAISTQEPFSPL